MTRPSLRFSFILWVASITLCLTLTTTVQAQSSPDEVRADSLAARLLDAGADGAAISQYALPFEDVTQLLSDVDPEIAEYYRRSWKNSFDEALLRREIAAHVAHSSTVEEIEAGLAWFRDPNVSKAVRLLLAGIESEQDSFFVWVEGLEEGDLDEERMESTKLISERTGIGQGSSSGITMRTTALRSAYEVSPLKTREALSDSLSSFQANLGRHTQTQQMIAYISNYYIFRDLSLEELAAYAEQLGSETGRWYVDTMLRALEYASRQGSERMMEAVRARGDSG